MNNGNRILVMLLAGLLAGPVSAQTAAENERRAEEQARQADRERRAAEEQRRAEAAAREREAVSMEAEMRAAEARLEEAARRIAELSTRRLPQLGEGRFGFAFSGRPMIGITIDGDSGDGPVEGVVVRGVTPGGPAFEAGLRAGDVITAVNDEALSADSSATANEKLLDFLGGVEEGDELDVEYMRDGTVAEVTIEPHPSRSNMFAFGAPRALQVPRAPRAPRAPNIPDFMFWQSRGGWADMEMVTLTEDLGRYFGTDQGLLVVRAPSDESLQLKDGDVIRAIDGREPTSVSHAVRILGSYQAGEALEIEIMRDKRRQTLEIEMPDNRRSAVMPRFAPGVVIDAPGVVVETPGISMRRPVRAVPGVRVTRDRERTVY